MDCPQTIEQASEVVRDRAAEGRAIRPRGGGTKHGWLGERPEEASEEKTEERKQTGTVDIATSGLQHIVEHNAGDFTAVLQAGVPLVEAQAAFARVGQMLALDPPTVASGAATIGGILATNDSGPMRHRYGSMRDVVIGITVVLSDGTVATSGGKVIKNVAGYDLAKLFTGSFGTLGLIVRVAVRLHPIPSTSATVVATSGDAKDITAAALALARQPIEADCLDVSWVDGSGKLLVRFAGAAAAQRARTVAQRITGMDVQTIVEDDDALWSEQRALQRAPEGIIVKVAGRPTDLPAVLRAADRAGGTVVTRAALGLSWIGLPSGADVAALRNALAPRYCTILDGAATVTDPWPTIEPGALAVMQRIKQRFDPLAAFRPGVFWGGS
jgi:glycolate dehydrogenase FAD-binding subunit